MRPFFTDESRGALSASRLRNGRQYIVDARSVSSFTASSRRNEVQQVDVAAGFWRVWFMILPRLRSQRSWTIQSPFFASALSSKEIALNGHGDQLRTGDIEIASGRGRTPVAGCNKVVTHVPMHARNYDHALAIICSSTPLGQRLSVPSVSLAAIRTGSSGFCSRSCRGSSTARGCGSGDRVHLDRTPSGPAPAVRGVGLGCFQ